MRLARSSISVSRLLSAIRCNTSAPEHGWVLPAWNLQCQMQSAIPFFSNRTLSTSQPADEERRRLINKMLYRSKQRGWLELDLLVGLWAEQQIPHMGLDMLQSYEGVLQEENPDLFKWLTGQLQPPEHMLGNPAFVALRNHVQQQMVDNSEPATHAASGKEWVRGWDDGSKQQQGAGAAGAVAGAVAVGAQ